MNVNRRLRGYLSKPRHGGVLTVPLKRATMPFMAKTTITHITDDIDGSKDASEVTFAYNGVEYSIDLAKKNQAAFEKALKPYLDAATRVGKRASARRSTSSRSSRPDLTAVRAWATEQGIEVSDRGRIAKAVLDQYDAAH